MRSEIPPRPVFKRLLANALAVVWPPEVLFEPRIVKLGEVAAPSIKTKDFVDAERGLSSKGSPNEVGGKGQKKDGGEASEGEVEGEKQRRIESVGDCRNNGRRKQARGERTDWGEGGY